MPNEPANASYYLPDEIMLSAYPYDKKTVTYSTCTMFNTNFSNENYSSKTPTKEIKPCDHWVYERSKDKITAVMDVSVKYLPH